MTLERIITIPLIDQHTDTGHVYWAPPTFALCSLKMVMMTRKPELESVSIMELVNKGLGMGEYDDRVGWRHQVLVDLASQYGVSMEYQKLFFKTREEKEKGLLFIEENIDSQKPVVVSIYYKLDPANGGHMVVIQGYKKKDQTEGYFIQDPASTYNGHNYFLDQETFIQNWRGGMLWLKD